MAKVVTLREANQGFARCVRDVEAGKKCVTTRNSTPVTRLVLVVGCRVLSLAQEMALSRTQTRMEKGWPLGAGPLDRDELHGR